MLHLFDVTHAIGSAGQVPVYERIGLLRPGGLGQQPRRLMIVLDLLRDEHTALLGETLKDIAAKRAERAADAEADRLRRIADGDLRGV